MHLDGHYVVADYCSGNRLQIHVTVVFITIASLLYIVIALKYFDSKSFPLFVRVNYISIV